MDGQYYPPQNHGLPLNCQYDENQDPSTQSPLQLLSYDHPPRSQLNHHFMNSPSSVSHILPEAYGIPTQMPMSQPPSTWNDPVQCSPSFSIQHGDRDEYSFEPSSYITANESDNMFTRGLDFGNVPRFLEPYNPQLPQENTLPNFDPSDYMTEEIKPNIQGCENNTTDMDYNTMDTSQNYLPLSMNRSSMQEDEFVRSPLPNDFTSADGLLFDKPNPFRMPSCEISEDGNISREMTAVEADEQGADEPYAKLIYRALMSAPNHSMVLQEIYQWFRDHTVKGSSDSKGWMNSIRHNLSMNAAFRKAERKLSGDDTKKSTEWVLEDFAIKDGVQSTTRYRKGTANKKFIRSETPAPSRQISGRKGGMSTKNSTRSRRGDRNRHRMPRIDTARRPLFQHHNRSLNDRQRSPLTPPHPEAPSPYYFQKLKQGYDLGFEGMCGLGDVQGVHIDDSPVFATNHEMQYHGFPAMSNHEHRY